MIDTIQVGPLALSLTLLLVVLSGLAGVIAALRFARRRGLDAAPAATRVAIAFLLAARAAHVWEYRDAYLAHPLGLLDFADGGWQLPFGLAVAWVVAITGARPQPRLRAPLFAGLGVFSVLLVAGFAVLRLHPLVGAPLAAIELRTLEGREARLADWAGRPTVVHLWATWCPNCLVEMPELQRAQQAHPDVNFVFVDQGESADRVRAFLGSARLLLHPVLLDESGRIAREYRRSAVPVTLLFDAAGRLAWAHTGALTPALLDQRLESLREPRAG